MGFFMMEQAASRIECRRLPHLGEPPLGHTSWVTGARDRAPETELREVRFAVFLERRDFQVLLSTLSELTSKTLHCAFHRFLFCLLKEPRCMLLIAFIFTCFQEKLPISLYSLNSQ